MPTEQRNKQVATALKALLFLFFSTLLSFSQAATLGRLTELSSLGQPLRAQVELLSVSPDEADSLLVRLAPGEAYRKSGVDYTALVQSLKLSVEKRGERYFAKISSDQAVNEPYIGIVLELSTGSERKGREYAIVLDPTEWTNLRTAPLSSAASTQRLSEQQQVIRKSVGTASAAVSPASVLGGGESGPAATEYTVARGDSLSKIAARLGRSDISLEQMLVALYRNNPDAFLGNNMNRLKEGAVLSIPDKVDAGDISQQEAKRTVMLHAANFRSYSHRLAGMVQKSAPGTQAKTGTVAEGKITANVKEQPTPASKSPDRLELSKAKPDATSEPAGVSQEEKVALKKSIEDANQRIAELEKNVSEIRSILSVMNKEGHPPTKPAETLSPDAKPTEENPRADKAATPDAKDEGLKSDQTLAKSEAKAEKKDVDVAKKKEGDDDEDEEAAKKRGFLYNLKNNTVWHIAIGAGAAFLALIGIVLGMRRKKPVAPVSSPAPVIKPTVAKNEEEDNPNIISGRNFLDNLPPTEIVEDEVDADSAMQEADDAVDAGTDTDPVEDIDKDEIAKAELRAAEEVAAREAAVAEAAAVKMAAAKEAAEREAAEREAAEREAAEREAAEREAAEREAAEREAAEAAAAKEAAEREAAEAAEAFAAREAAEREAAEAQRVDEDLAPVALQLDEAAPVVEKAVEAAVSEELPLELDLSDIDFDLDAPESAPDASPAQAEPEKPEPTNAEMAAKLELALAYLDMKDKEGARELLEEVIERGTTAQMEEARQVLQQLF